MSRRPLDPLERSLLDELLYGRSQDHLKIFVSSKMNGSPLLRERKAVIDAVDSVPPHRAWAWERDARAGPRSSTRVCEANAATSEGLILILAEELTTPTRKEYRAAKKGKVPRYVLVKEGVARSDEVNRFIEKERRGVVTAKFRNIRELKTQVREALVGHTMRVHRESILRARRRKS